MVDRSRGMVVVLVMGIEDGLGMEVVMGMGIEVTMRMGMEVVMGMCRSVKGVMHKIGRMANVGNSHSQKG